MNKLTIASGQTVLVVVLLKVCVVVGQVVEATQAGHVTLTPTHPRTIHNGIIIFTCSYIGVNDTQKRGFDIRNKDHISLLPNINYNNYIHNYDVDDKRQQHHKPPHLNFLWYLNGMELNVNSSQHTMLMRKGGQWRESYLRVDPVQWRKKEEVYSCGIQIKIAGRRGVVVKHSNNVTLAVYQHWFKAPLGFPRFQNNYNNNNNNNNINDNTTTLNVRSGETLSLPCSIQWSMFDDIRWYKDSLPLSNNNNNDVTSQRIISSLKDLGELKLGNVKSDEREAFEGYYECSVENLHGILFSPKIFVRVLEDPLHEAFMGDESKQSILNQDYQIRLVRVDPLSSTSVKLSWELLNKKKPTTNLNGFKICINESPKSIMTNECNLVYNASLLEDGYVISNLKKFQNYTVSIAPYLTTGVGPYSNVLPVQTFRDVPGKPVNLQVTALNGTSIHIKWQSPANVDFIWPIGGYKVYCLKIIQDYKDDLMAIIDVANGSNTEALVGGLEPGTTYNIQVAAYTRMGEGERSGRNVTTPHKAMDAPKNLTLTLTSGERPSIVASWRPPGMGGVVSQYKVQYGVKGQPHTINQEVLEGNKMKFHTRYLEKGVEYEFLVSARSSDDGWGEEAEASVVTPEGVPMGAPLNISSVDVSSRSFKLMWAPPMLSHRNGRIVMYEIRELSDHTMDDWMTNTTDNFYQISDLQCRSKYTYQVRAYTAVGSGPWSSSIEVFTLAEIISPPRNVKLKRLSPTDLEVSWQPPLHSSPSITYQVLYTDYAGRNLDEWSVEDTTSTSVTLRNLGSNSYVVRVRSRLDSGKVSDLSKAVTETVQFPSPIDNNMFIPAPPPSPTIVGTMVRNLVGSLVDGREGQEVVLEWFTPEKVGIKHYLVSYWASKLYIDEKNALQEFATSKQLRVDKSYKKVKIENLMSDTPYSFNVTSYFLDNTRNTSSTIHLHTAIREPPMFEAPLLLHLPTPASTSTTLPSLSSQPSSSSSSPSSSSSSSSYTYTLKLHGASGIRGPIKKYYVVLLASHLYEMKTPEDFNNKELNGLITPNNRIKRSSLASPSPLVSSSSPSSSSLSSPSNPFLIVMEYPNLPDRISFSNLDDDDADNDDNDDDDDYDDDYDNKNNKKINKTNYNGLKYNVSNNNNNNNNNKNNNKKKNNNNVGIDDNDDDNVVRHHFKKLQRGVGYKVFVRAFTANHLFTSSPYSSPFNVPHDPSLLSSLFSSSSSSSSSSSLSINDMKIIIYSLIPFCSLIFLIILFTACYRHRRRKTKSLEKKVPTSTIYAPNVKVNDYADAKKVTYEHSPKTNSSHLIKMKQLSGVLESLLLNDGEGLRSEYESIDPGQQYTWHVSSREVNRSKNRYANVVAYDHSRVILGEGGDDDDSSGDGGYINANYIDGYCRTKAFIATQGPMLNTLNDFWRMVWEQKASSIVMLTDLMERNRVKCDQYWPSSTTELYGFVYVSLSDVHTFATYTIRTFQLTNVNTLEKRMLTQYQFTDWPEQGVPTLPMTFLNFVRRVKSLQSVFSGPVVVHCSAGVGRTGVYIAADTLLDRLQYEELVDVFTYVTFLRSQRNYMVQTEDQYRFVYELLREAVEYGGSEVSADRLFMYINNLINVNPKTGISEIQLEFKKLEDLTHPLGTTYKTLSHNHRNKNRSQNIIPNESTRVHLNLLPDVPGSDYINANFIDGYKEKRAFIACQAPMMSTCEDFWRMLWEHKSSIIVMLVKLREAGKELCHAYWPEGRSARYRYFVVDPIAQYNMPFYVLREFKVTDARDGHSRVIRQFQYTDWPDHGVPSSGESFIEFIGHIQKTKQQFGLDNPVTIHCCYGSGRTGVFIGLNNALERLRYEGIIDMFQTIRLIKGQRSALVQTEEQYGFCYQAALEYLGSFDHLAT